MREQGCIDPCLLRNEELAEQLPVRLKQQVNVCYRGALVTDQREDVDDNFCTQLKVASQL